MAAFDDVVRAYVADPYFIRRTRLEQQVLEAIDDPSARIVLVTAEPGAGKSALLASLASQHPGWPRYFLRRDSTTRLGSEATSLLLAIGHQFAAAQPMAFDPQRLEIVVTQRIKSVAAGGTATAIRIDDLRISPFVTTALRVTQEVDIADGAVTAVQAGTATLEPRLLAPSVLQYLALIDPASVLAKDDPSARIVVLVDALDEAATSSEPGGIIAWLRELPELPANVRIVATSRPGVAVDGIRLRQAASVRVLPIDSSNPAVRDDLTRYARNLLSRVPASAIGNVATAEFRLSRLVDQADGNFAYLAAFARGVDAAMAAAARGEEQFGGLERLLDFESLPVGLDELYARFIQLIHDDVAGLPDLDVADPDGSTEDRVRAWPGVGTRLLGVLSVARAPLTAAQLQRLGGIRVWPDDVAGVLSLFVPFLDSSGGGVKWFHASIAEYLTSAKAAADHPQLAVHAPRWHTSIAKAYLGGASSWASVPWSTVDDYGLNHLASHLFTLSEAGDPRGQLFALLSPAWMRERRQRAGTDSPFLDDASLAIRTAARTPADIPQLVRCSLLYATARSLVGRARPGVIAIWARLGQVGRAWAGASAIEDRQLQLDAYAMMAQELAESGHVEAAAQAGRLAILQVMRLWDAYDRREAVIYLAPLAARLALIDFSAALLPAPSGMTALATGLADGGSAWPGLTAAELDQALDQLRVHIDQESDHDADAAIAMACALGVHGRGAEGLTLLEPLLSPQPFGSRAADMTLALAACGDRTQAILLADSVCDSFPTFTGPDGKRQKQVRLNDTALTKVARAFVRAGADDRGLGLALEMLDQGITGAVGAICNDLAASAERAKAGRVALAALDRARSLPPAQEVGDGSRVGTVDRLTGIATEGPPRVYRDDLLCSLVGPLARAGRPEADDAVAAVHDEHKRQVAQARLAVGQADAGDLTHAVQSLAAIADAKIRTWATVDVISACASSGRPDDVMDLLRDVDDHRARVQALGMLALAQARAGNVSVAVELSGQMDAESEVPGDQEAAAEALSAAATQLRDMRLAEEGFELACRASSHAGRARGGCRAAAAVTAGGHDVREQLRNTVTAELQQALDQGELDVAASVSALCSAGLAGQAAILISRVDPDGTSAASVGCALAAAGDFAAAEGMVSRAANPAIRVRILGALGVAQAARGMVSGALDRAGSVRELAHPPDGPGAELWLTGRVLGELACALASAGAFDAAVTVVGWASQMRGEEQTLHALASQSWDARRASLNDPEADAWQAIATAMGRSGRPEQARTLAVGITDVAYRTAMLTALASTLTESGEQAAPGIQALALELATTTFDESVRVIPEDPFADVPQNPVTDFGPWRWALVLADLGRNAARLGDGQGSAAAFDRARRAAGLESYRATESWALTHVALRLAQAGQGETALEVTRQASQAADRLSDNTVTPPWRWQLIDRVAQALAALGHLDDAVQVIDRIEDRYSQCSAALDLVDAAAEVPGTDERPAALVAVLSDLPGLSRLRVFTAVTRCASWMAIRDEGLLREVCDGVTDVERWWPSPPHAG